MIVLNINDENVVVQSKVKQPQPQASKKQIKQQQKEKNLSKEIMIFNRTSTKKKTIKTVGGESSSNTKINQ